jgi:hypothetical protein
MLITLAWIPLRVSVTLVAILTAILLPWALVKARRSLTLAAMTLAMLAMNWRGEAWKTVFLQSEQRVLELQRQLLRPISSNTGWLNPDLESLCASQNYSCRFAVTQSRVAIAPAARSTLGYSLPIQSQHTLPIGNDTSLQYSQVAGLSVYWALSPDLHRGNDLNQPLPEIASRPIELAYRTKPNTLQFYMTYINFGLPSAFPISPRRV